MNIADLFSLEGRVAVVTGASSGLGSEIARTLVAAGAQVAVAARRESRLKELAASVPNILPVACDLELEDDLVTLIRTTREQLGPVDILINNAGVVGDPVEAQSESRGSFERTVSINLTAPMRLAGMVFDDMRERGRGSIINVASISGVVGIGRLPQASYVASKTGLVGLTRELALQWARHGVRVNTIAPGFFDSEMTEPMMAVPKYAEWVTRNTPMPRLGSPKDFSGAVLLLASDAGSYITGQTIVVDGGWTAR
jgi:NAD(P)-dependent dehydrogenase (short-subunit alcohol dehydrogenase family)